MNSLSHTPVLFLSTPSARRATKILDAVCRVDGISIHALREEGDMVKLRTGLEGMVFLSTPSARRATPRICRQPECLADFYPRPPRGGRL